MRKGFTHQSFFSKNLGGFTLLEVIIAVSVVLVGVVAAVALITRTVSQTTLSSSRLIASYLSQEGIEIIRNIRDTNWLEQRTNPTNSWDEGLTCGIPPCNWEADYTATTIEDPQSAVPPLITTWTDPGSFLCLDTNGFYKYDAVCAGGTITKFKRKITIQPGGTTTLTVTVETAWQEKGKNYSHISQEILYNWK